MLLQKFLFFLAIFLSLLNVKPLTVLIYTHIIFIQISYIDKEEKCNLTTFLVLH